jgi:hypothetical protein
MSADAQGKRVDARGVRVSALERLPDTPVPITTPIGVDRCDITSRKFIRDWRLFIADIANAKADADVFENSVAWIIKRIIRIEIDRCE